MKTRFLLCLLPILLCVGCKKHECAELSWTDYNTVEDVWCNFLYNEDEFKQYVGDTLKVYGWLFKNTESFKMWQYLTSDKDVQFCENMSILYRKPTVTLYFGDSYYELMPENPYDSMLYVTGTVWYDIECKEYDINVTNVTK